MLENLASVTVLVTRNERLGRCGQGQSLEARESAGVRGRSRQVDTLSVWESSSAGRSQSCSSAPRPSGVRSRCGSASSGQVV